MRQSAERNRGRRSQGGTEAERRDEKSRSGGVEAAAPAGIVKGEAAQVQVLPKVERSCHVAACKRFSAHADNENLTTEGLSVQAGL